MDGIELAHGANGFSKAESPFKRTERRIRKHVKACGLMQKSTWLYLFVILRHLLVWVPGCCAVPSELGWELAAVV
eukprot:6464031-Amphidinium_carterae.1